MQSNGPWGQAFGFWPPRCDSRKLPLALHGHLTTTPRVKAMVSLAVFFACIASFFLIRAPPLLEVSSKLREVYGFFAPLNEQLIALSGERS